WSFLHGALFGLLPIGWTVFAAMLLYNVTVVTGQFAIIRRSIGSLSNDARVQAVLIGFAFGAFMEGAAGAGSPVAICGAMLVGLGSFALFQYTFATFHLWVPGVALWPLTDIGGGLFSLVSLALFLKFVWKPRDEWRFPPEAVHTHGAAAELLAPAAGDPESAA